MLYKEELNMLQQNNKELGEHSSIDNKHINHQYIVCIGSFVYRFSVLERTIQILFLEQFNLSPGHLKGVEDISSKDLFNACLKNKNDLERIKSNFEELRQSRNKIVHGLWMGWALGNGLSLEKPPNYYRKKPNQNNKHFSEISGLKQLNEKSKCLIDKIFALIAKDEMKRIYNDTVSLSTMSEESLHKIGLFVYQFSQLEQTIRAFVADTFKAYKGSISTLFEQAEISSLKLLSFYCNLLEQHKDKLSKPSEIKRTEFIQINEDFIKLNDKRNSIIHKCSSILSNIDAHLEDIQKLHEKIINLWLGNAPSDNYYYEWVTHPTSNSAK